MHLPDRPCNYASPVLCMGDTKACTCSDNSRRVYRCGKHIDNEDNNKQCCYQTGAFVHAGPVTCSVKLILLCIIFTLYVYAQQGYAFGHVYVCIYIYIYIYVYICISTKKQAV